MTIEVDAGFMRDTQAHHEAERDRWTGDSRYVDPAEPGRRYFSVEHDCISYTLVAESEAAARAMMPGIHALMMGAVGDEKPDPTWEESVVDSGEPVITEILGTEMIWCDGRDGLQHAINTYALGAWASSEY